MNTATLTFDHGTLGALTMNVACDDQGENETLVSATDETGADVTADAEQDFEVLMAVREWAGEYVDLELDAQADAAIYDERADATREALDADVSAQNGTVL